MREGVEVSRSNSAVLEDHRIGVRLKISALWTTMLFLFAHGDIFGFLEPGRIREVMGGEISGIEITEASCSRSRSTSRSPA